MEKLGKILKIVLIIAIVCVLVLLTVNIVKSDHKELQELTRTDSFEGAYAISSQIRTHLPQNEGFSENGGVFAYSLYYIEESGYIQVTVRYNKRHMDDIKQSYAEFDESKIHFTLTDTNGKLYKAKVVEKASKYHYEYFKLEFTNIDFKDTDLTLNMVIDVLSEVIGKQNSVVLHKKDQMYVTHTIE